MIIETTGRWHLGAAQSEITPTNNLDISGGAFGPALGMRHPLTARALWLSDSREIFLLLSCDLLAFDEAIADRFRQDIATATGLKVSQVMLSATHTHGAPATVSLRNWGRIDSEYLDALKSKLVSLTVEASSKTIPVRISWGSGTVSGVSCNRVLGDTGPIDPNLGVLAFHGADDRPVALILNYACHPVNLHGCRAYTPDFPYFLRRRIGEKLGEALPIYYLSGMGGDLNPANFGPERSDRLALETADKLALQTFQILERLQPLQGCDLVTDVFDCELPLQSVPETAELERIFHREEQALSKWSQPAFDDWDYCKHRTMLEWSQSLLRRRIEGALSNSRTMKVQAVRIGELGLLGVPAEPFCDYGMQLKSTNALRYVFHATVTNGCLGYLPTPAGFAKNCYEAAHCYRYLGDFAFATGVGEIFCERARLALKRLGAGIEV